MPIYLTEIRDIKELLIKNIFFFPQNIKHSIYL